MLSLAAMPEVDGNVVSSQSPCIAIFSELIQVQDTMPGISWVAFIDARLTLGKSIHQTESAHRCKQIQQTKKMIAACTSAGYQRIP